MKVKDHLRTDSLEKLQKINKQGNKKKNHNRIKKPKKDEKVNWNELMGSGNRGMKRGKGGAYRNA